MTAEIIDLVAHMRKSLGLPPKTTEPAMDVQFENHGSIWLARPLTNAGLAWVEDNIPDDAQWFARAIVVEPRYVGDIVEGMQADGLEVGGPT
jgi:hypothetical protein